jgi:hemoglobin
MTNSFIMRISANDFNALVEDLVAALDKFNVPAQEKKDLLALLGPMKKDIVEEP